HLSRRINLYKLILRDKCHISLVLTQIGRIPETDRDLLVPLLPMSLFYLQGPEETLQRGENAGIQVKSLDDYLEAMRRGLQEWKAKGVVGMKMRCSDFSEEIPRDTAEREFIKLLGGKEADLASLNFFIHNEMLTIAGKLNLVVAVHCGILWNNWNDFYTTHPRYMIPLLLRHQKTKFDLYHAGIPWVREMGVIGKDFPNAYLNLCWCHIISPRMTVSLLDEWMDLVPLNKITGFGGDYCRPVEKVYGHLMMAKQNIARVLAGRVSDGLMSEKEALRVAQQFLFENPKELYQLDGKKL
ncbi:amidohydrolase family protein, partial [Verrucomicrobiota bacterium]